jgi:hypothetical protein
MQNAMLQILLIIDVLILAKRVVEDTGQNRLPKTLSFPNADEGRPPNLDARLAQQ